jgi:hypothetical protein
VVGALRRYTSANRSFNPLAELDHAIRRYFAAFSREQALCLINYKVARTIQMALMQSELDFL